MLYICTGYQIYICDSYYLILFHIIYITKGVIITNKKIQKGSNNITTNNIISE